MQSVTGIPDTPRRPAHGGLNPAELQSLGLRPEDVTDFSASVNPLGPSPRALAAARAVNLAAYPDPDCLMLRQAIGRATGVAPECILPGNGSTELIHLLTRAYLRPGDAALIFAPTFGEYAAACRIQGVEPDTLHPAGPGFRWDLPSALERIAARRPSLVFLCNPNNPTGVYWPQDAVRSIAAALPDSGLLILDEAYVAFAENAWDSTPLLPTGKAALLRSMTKDYALTGLRLGYMLAPEKIIARVAGFQYSWSVNAPAQAAGIAALSDAGQVARGRDAVRAGKDYLANTARDLGLECVIGAANFLLFRVGDAAEVRAELLQRHKICVRDCASFGLPQYIRIGVRVMDDNRKLSAALRQVLESLGGMPMPNDTSKDDAGV